jgi:RimJ/RimL family protein N-acetyltransferase
MRAAILHLAFAGLGAQRAISAAFEHNAASLAVSRALGYVENGDDIGAPRGKPMRQIRLLLTREAWENNRRRDIQIHGLEPCLRMFGLDRKDG